MDCLIPNIFRDHISVRQLNHLAISWPRCYGEPSEEYSHLPPVKASGKLGEFLLPSDAACGIGKVQPPSEHVPTRIRTYWALISRVSLRLPTGGG